VESSPARRDGALRENAPESSGSGESGVSSPSGALLSGCMSWETIPRSSRKNLPARASCGCHWTPCSNQQDLVTLHVPLDPSTAKMLDAAALSEDEAGRVPPQSRSRRCAG